MQVDEEDPLEEQADPETNTAEDPIPGPLAGEEGDLPLTPMLLYCMEGPSTSEEVNEELPAEPMANEQEELALGLLERLAAANQRVTALQAGRVDLRAASPVYHAEPEAQNTDSDGLQISELADRALGREENADAVAAGEDGAASVMPLIQQSQQGTAVVETQQNNIIETDLPLRAQQEVPLAVNAEEDVQPLLTEQQIGGLALAELTPAEDQDEEEEEEETENDQHGGVDLLRTELETSGLVEETAQVQQQFPVTTGLDLVSGGDVGRDEVSSVN